MDNLKNVLNKLEINTEKKELIQSIMDRLDNDSIEIKEKIAMLKRNRLLLTQCNVQNFVIKGLIHLIETNEKEVELYFIISEFYKAEKKFELAELFLLKLFSVADKVYPYFYNTLANFYLDTNQLLLAENAIKKAIQGNPNNFHFYVTYAHLEEKKFNNILALEYIDKAISMLDENINAEINCKLYKIHLLYQSMEEAKAKILLSELLEKYPDDERIKKRAKDIKAILSSDVNQVKAKTYVVSLVVDALSLHYYQAELLLYSLEVCAKVQKEHILVQCLDRVDKVFLDYLDKEGYRYRIIEPYLDGKYCNKLQQLEAFKTKDLIGMDGIILLDTDMFVLHPFDIPNSHLFSAKTVDAPNPPLKILQNIFKEANIDTPKIVHSDWKIADNQTFACNFNGGFYYVPSAIVSELSSEWRKWASWLYDRSDLFANKQQSIHTDQVSMAMAVTSLQIPYQNLPANSNIPIHQGNVLTSLKDKKEITLLHYHREITPFGLLNNKNVSHQKIIDAIDKANNIILRKEEHHFFLQYKKSLVSKIYIEQSLKDIDKVLKEMTASYSEKLRLIVHAGTPKTATTSLQFFLYDHHDILLQKGILYPKVYIDTPAPKHQWMVSALMTKNYRMFLDKLKKGLEEARSDTHTVILSTEGIYNHWHDYSSESKAFLVLLSKYFNMHIWVWFRNPASFAKSLYHQYMKNQRLPSVKCYGHNMTFDEMLEDEWFIKHLDYTGFLLECGEMFGEENISSFILDGDIIKMVSHKLGLHIDSKVVERKNISLTCASVEILKIINNYPLPGAQKNKAVESLYEIDTLLKSYTQEDKSCNTSSESIHRLFALQHPILKEKYCLDFKE